MSDSGGNHGLADWLRARAEVEQVVLDEDELTGLATRMAALHASLARLQRYDLREVDYAVQPPVVGGRT